MKKILFTSNVSWAMIKFRYNLLKYLVENGYEVYIVAPKDEFVKELEEIGCICIDIKLSRKGVNPIEDLKLTYSLYKIYKKISPNIIFNYSIKPIIYGSIAARLANIPSIAVNIGLGYTFINTNLITKISHLLYKFSLQFPKQVWFINEDDRNEFVTKKFVKENKTLILPSEGIDTEYFCPKKIKNNENKIIFLLIARILWDKGIGEYYEAAKIIKQKYKNVEFQLVGGIDLENPKGIMPETIETWVNEGVINYIGFKKDVRKNIAKADCIVLPSYREGKGMTLIEAGSMNKPLIATNVEGCKDIVKDGYNGFLCEVKNSSSLANVFEKFILLDESQKTLMGNNSRKFICENFSVNKVIDIYLKQGLKGV